MRRILNSSKLLAAIAGIAMVAAEVPTAQADPWQHHNHGGPVIIVRPGYYYPPPPVYYVPPPPVYYAPPPPPPVYYAPAPVYAAPAPAAAIVCRQGNAGAVLGTAAGGAAGAIIGATASHGRWSATAGGAILGMLLGGSIGASADAFNRSCAAQAVAYGPIGQPVGWAGPGGQYQVIPEREYIYRGLTCRDYQARAFINGVWQHVVGRSCLEPNGIWQVVN